MSILVVTDTSPVRALDHLNLLHLLQDLFQRVYAPPAVLAELAAANSLTRVRPYLTEQAPRDLTIVSELRQSLHSGESEAIALALELRPDYVLVDERDGREEAHRRGLHVMGVLGLLVRAKVAGRIPLVMPLVEELIRATEFRASGQLLRQIRQLAGE